MCLELPFDKVRSLVLFITVKENTHDHNTVVMQQIAVTHHSEPAPLWHHKHDTNTSEVVTNLQTRERGGWQTGSILCLASEQLLVPNRDHKCSLWTARPAAARRSSLREEETWVGGRLAWPRGSICSLKSWIVLRDPDSCSKVGRVFVIWVLVGWTSGHELI